MWLFTPSGFISAVSPETGQLLVRARDSKSLESLAFKFKKPIIHTPTADYPYRLKLSHQDFESWVINQVLTIDYPNFKSEVSQSRGFGFAKALNQVWAVMHDVEDKNARVR